MKHNLKAVFVFVLSFALICSMSIVSMADDYTYESELAKLADEIQAMENIEFVDDMDASATGLAIDNNKLYPYGSAYFHGSSGGILAFEFAGTTVGLVVEKGGYDIYIDDEFVETVGVGPREDRKGQLVYFNDKLENDYHTIQVVVNSEKAFAYCDGYSVIYGFLVQAEVEPIPTAVPTEAPTKAPATEAPTKAPATEAPVKEESGCGKSSAVAHVMIILGAALIIKKKK